MRDDLHGDDPGFKGPSKPTLCIECSWKQSVGTKTLCGNARFATAKPAIDYVTGQVVNEVRPECRVINKGQCAGFVRRNDPINTWLGGTMLAVAIIAAFVILMTLFLA